MGHGLGCLCLRAQGSLVVPCSGWLRMIQTPSKQSPGVVPENRWGAASAILAIVNRTTWSDCEFEAPLAGLNCSLFHWDGVVPRSTSSQNALWRCLLFCSLLGGHCSPFFLGKLGKWKCFPPGDTSAVRALCDVYLGWTSLQTHLGIHTTESDYCASACFCLGLIPSQNLWSTNISWICMRQKNVHKHQRDACEIFSS